MLANPITKDKTELTPIEQAEQERLQRMIDDLNRQIIEVAVQIQRDLIIIGLKAITGECNAKNR